MGIAAALVYVSLGRRRIDYRYILLGAVLPDLFDAVLIATGAVESSSLRGPGHSLLAVPVVAVVIILGLRGERRLAVFGIAVGWLTHLVADGMWNSPKTFLWPLFGNAFDATPAEPYSWSLFTAPAEHLSTWGAELVGLGILWWFWVAFRLGHENRFALFRNDGYLRP